MVIKSSFICFYCDQTMFYCRQWSWNQQRQKVANMIKPQDNFGISTSSLVYIALWNKMEWPCFCWTKNAVPPSIINKSKKNKQNKLILMAACNGYTRERAAIRRFLLHRGANLEQIDNFGKAPLPWPSYTSPQCGENNLLVLPPKIVPLSSSCTRGNTTTGRKNSVTETRRKSHAVPASGALVSTHHRRTKELVSVHCQQHHGPGPAQLGFQQEGELLYDSVSRFL